jgi:hypothetical protein
LEVLILEGYKAGRSFYSIPRGSYLKIKTKLYCLFQSKPQCITGITDSNSVYVWIIKQDMYIETVIKFFELYQSFDKFAFSSGEINQCSYDIRLFKQIFMENKIDVDKKKYYFQELEMNTTILLKG